MRRWPILLAVAFFGAWVFGASPDIAPSVAPVLDPARAGRELAARLRASSPSENSEFRGTLIIRQRGVRTNSIPVHSFIVAHSTHWQVTYVTTGAGGTPSETLVITHTPAATNEYLFARGTNLPASLAVDQANIPLAGSDFWLSDLGMEFLHWPQQRLLKHEMTRGRSCRVLESVNLTPQTNGYARIVSWIDVETDGLLRAEAYDKTGNLLKEFFVGPVKKVNGQWQLKDMKMVSPKNRNETELRFDLESKAAAPLR